MTHKTDDLVGSMSESALEFYQLRDELEDLWRDFSIEKYKKASWKAKLLMARYLASKEMEQRYYDQFNKTS